MQVSTRREADLSTEDPEGDEDVSPEKARSELPAADDALAGLRDARYVSLERSPIRTRENLLTRSAWVLRAVCAQGEGTISLVELSPSVSLYRGEGVFLGWSSDRLHAAYQALLPRVAEGSASESDFPQLG